MTYRLVQLAPGSYDVELDGMVVASLVQSPTSRRWTAELLDERQPHPAPFTAAEHRFDSFTGARGGSGARKSSRCRRQGVRPPDDLERAPRRSSHGFF